MLIFQKVNLELKIRSIIDCLDSFSYNAQDAFPFCYDK